MVWASRRLVGLVPRAQGLITEIEDRDGDVRKWVRGVLVMAWVSSMLRECRVYVIPVNELRWVSWAVSIVVVRMIRQHAKYCISMCSILEQLIVYIRKGRVQPCDYTHRTGLQPRRLPAMIEYGNYVPVFTCQLHKASDRMCATVPRSPDRDATLEHMSHERALLRNILVYHAAPALHICSACKSKQLQLLRRRASLPPCDCIAPGYLGRYKQALTHTLCACMHMQPWILGDSAQAVMIGLPALRPQLAHRRTAA